MRPGMGYLPQLWGATSRNRIPHTILYCLDICDLFFSEIIRAITGPAGKHGYGAGLETVHQISRKSFMGLIIWQQIDGMLVWVQAVRLIPPALRREPLTYPTK